MATISAWAVGLLVLDTELQPFPTTLPSYYNHATKRPSLASIHPLEGKFNGYIHKGFL